jgi:hypothetical protein
MPTFARAGAIPGPATAVSVEQVGLEPEQANEALAIASSRRSSAYVTTSMRSFSSASAFSSRRPVARKRCTSSAAKPGEV